jgi:hypothetical protein
MRLLLGASVCCLARAALELPNFPGARGRGSRCGVGLVVFLTLSSSRANNVIAYARKCGAVEL